MNHSNTELRRLSQRASEIRPAPTLAIASRARQMRLDGIDVVSFSTGEPDFDTPESIAAAGIEAIRSGFTHYTDAKRLRRLRISTAFAKRRLPFHGCGLAGGAHS